MMVPTTALVNTQSAAMASQGGASFGGYAATGIAGAGLAASLLGPLLQASQQKKLAQANNANAQAAYSNQLKMIALRQQQEQAQAAQEIDAISRQSLAAKSTAFASANEGGVAGNSVNALMLDYKRRELGFIQRTQRQTLATMYQLEVEKEGVWAQSQGRMMGGPNSMATAMQMVGGAANTLSNANFSSALGINWAGRT